MNKPFDPQQALECWSELEIDQVIEKANYDVNSDVTDDGHFCRTKPQTSTDLAVAILLIEIERNGYRVERGDAGVWTIHKKD